MSEEFKGQKRAPRTGNATQNGRCLSDFETGLSSVEIGVVCPRVESPRYGVIFKKVFEKLLANEEFFHQMM